MSLIQLTDAETALKTFIYNLQDPIDETVFQRIDNFAEIADMANVPISLHQKNDLAMLILIKSKRFQLDIRTWNARPPIEYTWENFQDSFRLAYDALRDLGDITLAQSSVLNQAQLMKSIMHAMQIIAAAADDSPPPEESPPPPPEQRQPEQHAGNAFESTLLKKIAELTAELSELKQGMSQCNSRSSHGRTPKRYCWSCGCCLHWGRDCEDKKPRHKNDATFKERKGVAT